MYGSETWPSAKTAEEKLRLFERKVLRKIYGPIFNSETLTFEKRSNESLYDLFKEDIAKLINNRRLSWAGHVYRMNGLANKVLTAQMDGKRPRGRPKTRWMDRVQDALFEVAPDAELSDAEDREKWSSICASCMA